LQPCGIDAVLPNACEIVSSSWHSDGISAMRFTKIVPFYLPRAACLCLAAVLASCAPQAQRMPTPTGPSAADIAFQSLSRRYFDEVLALQPVQATALGDHRYDDKLDDVSAAGRERRLALEPHRVHGSRRRQYLLADVARFRAAAGAAARCWRAAR
jgi:hypothetical protein